MKITPIDIQHQKFEKRFRGYDTRDVDSFLQKVSDTIESLMGEKQLLNEELERLSAENREFRAREEAFRQVMLDSYKTIEEMRRHARKKSEMIIAQAEMDAEKMMNSAHEKLAEIYDDINELLRQRVRFREQLRSEINTHKNLLEVFSRDEAGVNLRRVGTEGCAGEIKAGVKDGKN